MVKFIGDRCHADTLSGIAERLRAGYLHDIIIGITGYARLVRRLERTSEVLAEIHGKIGEVLYDDHVVFVGHLADDLQLLIGEAEPSRIVRVGIDDSRDIPFLEVTFQFLFQFVATEIIYIECFIFLSHHHKLLFLYRKSQPTVKVYETIVPETADLEKTTVATGKVEPRDEVLIKPQISGIISEVYKEAGQSVKQGEVIAKVKVIPELGTLNSAESRVRLAEINAKQAETDFARVEKLFNDKLISNEEYEKGEVNVKQAREELQTAKDNLEIVKEGITKNSASFSSTLIRSTITGLILDVPIKVGNSVIMSNTFNDGTTIATVANMNDLIFRGNLDETEVGRVHEGMPVKLTIGALQNLSFNAVLEYISPKGVEENGANQFEIKAAIQAPDSVQIRSGYSANAEIVLERALKTLALPESTVEFSGDSTFVYVLTDSVPQQKFKRQQIEVGMSDGIKIAVKSGLTAKDKVRGAEKKDK